MRRVIAPALLAVFMFAGNSADAGFGLFDRLCGHSACDSGCAVEPACGCEIAAPVCGCEVAPACEAPCGPKKHGLLHKLFHHHHNGCDACAEPTCGCEMSAVDCGCAVVEPACGCEVAPACGCDSGCGHKHGLLHKLFHHHGNCGCDVAPACEPSCGCGF